MRTHSLKIFILVLAGVSLFLALSAAYATPAYKPMPAFVREGFAGCGRRIPAPPNAAEGFADGKTPAGGPYESPATVGALAGANSGPERKSGPAPVKKVAGTPYTLLEDHLETTRQDIPHYGENALSCYAKDWWRGHEKTGNYRQETNNYRQDYPDSCTTGFQEGVLSFYKREGKYA